MGQCEVGNRHVDGLTRPCTRVIELVASFRNRSNLL
jgi:hypothetical protein